MTCNSSTFTGLIIACLVVQTCADGEVRLINGANVFEGLVEVFFDGQWGTICDDGWDIADAHVVCRQLGRGYAVSAYGEGSFGRGSGPIAMDEVQCVGDEERLDQCSFRGWFLHDCIHQEDAGVRCSTEDGGLRLVGGNTLYEGRVEVFSSGAWGTICDDSWDDNDAAVVCRALGFRNPARSVDRAFFGEGTGEISLSNIDCDGTERRLEECNQRSGFVNNCEHSEDAGVICTPQNTPISNLCNDYDVRIVRGTSVSDGFVEVCYKGFWGTVCADSWTKKDAIAVCRQLGHNVVETFYSRVSTSTVANQIVEQISCEGDETDLSHCEVTFGYQDNCTLNAGVRCATKVECVDGQIRLEQGDGVSRGKVQVCQTGHIVNVCGTSWGYNEAIVVCRQLGYSSASSYDYVSVSGTSSDMRSVSCRGSEVSLSQCFIRSDPGCTRQATVTCSNNSAGGGSDGDRGGGGGSGSGSGGSFDYNGSFDYGDSSGNDNTETSNGGTLAAGTTGFLGLVMVVGLICLYKTFCTPTDQCSNQGA